MDRLHPAVQALLHDQGWSGLTAAQDAALPPLQAGKHVLLVAPTGYGKTEAAMLPVFSRLLHEKDAMAKRGKEWPLGFKALYVTPLRALNRDLQDRLESWADALGLRIAVRHGDTKQSERAKQSRNPPDVLITTPETLQLLLYGDNLRKHLGLVRFVIVDEVHDLCVSERGAQLAIALERIEEVVAQPAKLREEKAKNRPCPKALHAPAAGAIQRIGLSATIADAERVGAWLTGPGRDVAIVRVEAPKKRTLHVALPVEDGATAELSADLSLPAPVAAELSVVRSIVAAHQRALVFVNTREGCELLASRSVLLDAEQPLLEAHHGSLSADHRRDVEQRFKAGAIHAVVATSSLELGIDVGAIDHVVQVHSPRSVARMLQRLGRAGHRVGATSEGTLVAAGVEDALECWAIARMALQGELEDVRPREAPLVALANQMVALSNEYASLNRDWVHALVTRSGAYADLDEGMFAATWDALLDVRTMFEETPGTFARGGRARKHFLDHISLIPDERTYRVLDEATKRSIGTVDDSFVAAGLHPGAMFIMGGRNWRVLEVDAEAQLVRVGQANQLGQVADWAGSQLPVSYEVARHVMQLRRELVEGNVPGDVDVAPGARAAIMDVIQQQQDAGLVIPTDRLVTIEPAGREWIINVGLGTRGNEALGRITQGLLHQRIGTTIGLHSDAYRIRITLPQRLMDIDLEELWRGLDPNALDLVLAMLLRESPGLRHHLVHVAKNFGALPKDLDPNRFSKAKLDDLLGNAALHEESIDRLVHERLDIRAVHEFLVGLNEGSIQITTQAQGPISRLGQDAARRMLSAVDDERLLAQVRQRIEETDVLMVCTQCRNASQSQVHLLMPRIHCRRCSSNQVACLRPWNQDELHVLGNGKLTVEESKRRVRIQRNASLVGSFGATACRALVARGIGPDTAARILQKAPDPETPSFWREILRAELEFARTSSFWK